MSAQGRAARRDLLFRRDPHCYWCRRMVVPPRPGGGRQASNAATLDHLLGRRDPERSKGRRGNDAWTVLACYGCNTSRAHREDANVRSGTPLPQPLTARI